MVNKDIKKKKYKRCKIAKAICDVTPANEDEVFPAIKRDFATGKQKNYGFLLILNRYAADFLADGLKIPIGNNTAKTRREERRQDNAWRMKSILPH